MLPFTPKGVKFDLKGQKRKMVFWLNQNLSKVGSEDLKFFSWCSIISRDMLNFNTFSAVKRILHIRREHFFQDY